jgi:sigma-B regulation protein RsbU (phosphoserine phosphatase)
VVVGNAVADAPVLRPPDAAGAPRRVLLVDDSRAQRRMLAALLGRAGYIVSEADSGEAALAKCRVEPFDFVISDWMMPGMSGPDLCRSFRALGHDHYGYFILLTSKAEKAEVAHGLGAGADDFLTKPFNTAELRARIAAGERILRMERELKDKNRLVTSTLSEIQGLYDSIKRDLVEAQKLQQSLIRERHRSFGRSEVSLLLRPSGHVGGDLVGFFPINARRVGIFALDVAGHGITSAMMTARLAGYLSGTSPEQNIALILTEFGIYDAHEPAELAAELNRIVIEEMQIDSYFTLAYADVDLVSGRASMIQAGHPHPAHLRANGDIEFLGQGGLPIGMFADARFEGFEITLEPGDRLLLMSDGFTEAADAKGTLLGEDGLARLLRANAKLSGLSYLEALTWDLGRYSGDEFADDVSAALFEFRGAKENAD